MGLVNYSINVLVSGVAGATIGEQICKSLRLGQNKYIITASNLDLASIKTVEADQYELLPRAQDPMYIERLQSLCTRHKVKFVFPGSEPELFMLAEMRDCFEGIGVEIVSNSAPVISVCSNKLATFAFLREQGFSIPLTYAVEETHLVEQLPDRFPWIVKPFSGGSGSANVFIAQDREELAMFVRYLTKNGHSILLQEYVGRAEDEYTVGVLHYPDGTLAGSVALRRHITTGLSNRLRVQNRCGRSSDLGSVLAVSSGITQGELGDYPAIRKTAEAIARSLGSTGPLNIQGRWNGQEFLPFEINPRFSGTEPLRAMVGFNGPEAIVNWYLTGGREHPSMKVEDSGVFTRGLREHFEPY
jgi:carbamoyl-phosphate synthase large subunit